MASVHVIGAGLAGLSAAIRLVIAGLRVVVHEAAGQAGGRCRSYHDPALNMEIDNGNHLVLSGNGAVLDYVRTIGAEHHLVGPSRASFPFVDLANGERWTIDLGSSRIPWWVFDRDRWVPGTRLIDYLKMAPLAWASRERAIGEVVDCRGALYEKLMRPLLLAALNTEPKEATAGLAAAVLRETLLKGGAACRPLIARDGLGATFVAPALAFLHSHGAVVQFGHRLRALSFADGRADCLNFGDDEIALAAGDAVILAVPPVVATSLLPDLTAPDEFRAIVNAHFRVAPSVSTAPITGVINGTVEWIFGFPERLSVTISGADRLVDAPREELAQTIWREVAEVTGMGDTGQLPPWQIVRERRATFAAIPEMERKRPGAGTAWNNVVLAGDWTATGLPATIEGAIRSGNRAAAIVSGRFARG